MLCDATPEVLEAQGFKALPDGLSSTHLFGYKAGMEAIAVPEYHTASNMRLVVRGKRLLIAIPFSELAQYIYNTPGARGKSQLREPLTHAEVRTFIRSATPQRMKHLSQNGVPWTFATSSAGSLIFLPAGWLIVEKSVDWTYGVCVTSVTTSSAKQIAAFVGVSEASNVVGAQLLEMKLMLCLAW